MSAQHDVVAPRGYRTQFQQEPRLELDNTTAKLHFDLVLLGTSAPRHGEGKLLRGELSTVVQSALRHVNLGVPDRGEPAFVRRLAGDLAGGGAEIAVRRHSDRARLCVNVASDRGQPCPPAVRELEERRDLEATVPFGPGPV